MSGGPRRTTAERGYGTRHQAIRAAWDREVARGGVPCARCGQPIAPGEAWHLDHADDRRGYLGPSHAHCNSRAGALKLVPPRAPVPEPDGHGREHPVWAVPWLDELRELPAEATWPRLMTPPHPLAVGTLAGEFVAAAEQRAGRQLRWWQRLVSARLLEVDEHGVLCWPVLILTLARQLGKSWWLRELLLWRLEQTERYGEPQTILHTGKDLPVCRDVQRPVRAWARERPERYTVYEANGRESIELVDGSRWVIKARTAVYGLSAGMAAVDEGWKVAATAVDDGIVPTMVEREQPQLLLISTAHRAATSLMLNRRRRALAALERPGSGDLLIEWSAPRDVELEDRRAWRAASPHWTAQRERVIADALAAARAGQTLDVDEPDPLEAFRAQWLNQWPVTLARSGAAEPLLTAGAWDALRETGLDDGGPVWVGLEDDYGLGAAVACVRRLEDGRLEADGWARGDWDSAVADAQALAGAWPVRRVLVGASLLDRLPPGLRAIADPRGRGNVAPGLALLRDLVASGALVHDVVTGELDEALARTLVREAAGGLTLLPKGPTHLVRALVWALQAAHRPTPAPAVF